MYQTVAHQLIPAYAAATGLPLLRRRITGSSQHMVTPRTTGSTVMVTHPWSEQAWL